MGGYRFPFVNFNSLGMVNVRLTPIEPEIPEEGGFTTENDIFLYREFGERLANLVSNIDEPLVIILDAPWGSGKSVFIKQWAGLMRARGGSVVHFDAFGNDLHEDAFLALASEIHLLAEKTLGEGNKPTKTFLYEAKKVGKTLAPIGLRLAARVGTVGLLSLEDVKAGGDALRDVIKIVGDETEEALENTISEKLQKTEEEHKSFEKFRKSLENVSRAIAKKGKTEDHQSPPLVFIVDELDRCRPPFALGVIERIKHLFSVPSVCFVLVTHLPQLETSVQGAYGAKFDARTYLEKFYHLRVTLPEPSDENQKQRNRYLDYLWRNLKPEFKSDRQDELIIEEFRFLVNAHKLSLRQIERALTNVVLAVAGAKEERWFIPPVIAGLCIMRQKYQGLYELARENSLAWEEDIKDFLKVNRARNHKEWVITSWRFFIDPNLPRESIKKFLGMSPDQYTYEERRFLQRVLTDYIDNLPNPPEHNT